MTQKSNKYFFKAYLTILIAIGVFLVFKEVLPKKIFDVEVVATDGIVVDSMALAAMTNAKEITIPQDDNTTTISTIVNDTTKVGSADPTTISRPPVNTISIDASQYSVGYGNLEAFFEKVYNLEKTKKGKVRVAYFSDSMTDGDLIVQDIRKAYQKKYGGRGVGFVGVTSLSAGSRGSVNHSYSKNWQNQSFLRTQKPRRPFGIDGQVAFAPNGASTWIRYQAGNLENSTALYNPTLFYGSSKNKNGMMTIKINSDSVMKEPLNTNDLLNTYKVNSSPNSIKVDFTKADSIPFYGINFDDGRGFHIDNFSIRGNSGLPLSILNTSLMNAFDQLLNYDLIILHYGANVLNYSTKDYSWYRKSMTNVVNHLKECFPKADILIVSTADKSDKVDGQMQTSVAVAPLIKAQSDYAQATYSGFLNLYSLMGGNGSMVQWVNNGLANKDYTHFSIKGAHKIGLLIYGDLNKGYLEYKRKKYGIEYSSDEGANSTQDIIGQ